MFDIPEPDSPWSAEGLTVYTTYRIVKELYGEEYAQTHYIDQWKQEVDDYYLNFYVRHPKYLDILLSYFLDMSDAEIAELLNVVRTTVFRHRKSALAKIKQYLEGKADDEYR